MLAGATRGAGGPALARHLLSRKGGQQVEVMEPRGLASERLPAQLAELVAASAHGRTERPVHHVHIDPPPDCEDPRAVIDAYIAAYEIEFGLAEGPRCGVFHTKAGRTHAHVVWSLVRENGRVVDLGYERARREKVSRVVEYDCRLPFVRGAHNRAVAAALRREGRGDIAEAITAAGLLDGRRQRAASTPEERAQAERTGVPIAEIRSTTLTAWRSSDDGRAFVAALKAQGLQLAAGERGMVLVDRNGGTHSLTRILSAAVRAAAPTGAEKIPAAAVKRRLAGVPLRTTEEVKNDRHKATDERRSGDLPGGSERKTDVGATPSIALASGGAGGIWGPDPDSGAPVDDGGDPRAAHREPGRHQGSYRTRWTECDRAAVAALRRVDLRSIRARAEAIRQRPARRAVRDDAVVHALSRTDFSPLLRNAGHVLGSATAGSIFAHPEFHAHGSSAMVIKGFGRTSRSQDFKTKLLADAVPGFDADRWSDDLHMVRAGGPSTRPRILTKDNGWLEIDRRAGIVRIWGQPGKADALAKELAAAGGWEVKRLAPSGRAKRKGARTPRPKSISQHATADLVAWWRERGYQATATPTGAWVDAGGSHLHDTGDHVELHGALTTSAARALVLKASEAWDGAAELSGPWSRRDQDTLWLEAQRAGVELHCCTPSDAARRAWEEEVRAAKAHSDTIGLVRDAAREAEVLRAAAGGDMDALGRLSPELHAFVSSFLDDEQRQEIADADPVDIIPELGRFRSRGADEIPRMRRRPEPGHEPPRPGNSMRPKRGEGAAADDQNLRFPGPRM